jgi:hypothetical protein
LMRSTSGCICFSSRSFLLPKTLVKKFNTIILKDTPAGCEVVHGNVGFYPGEVLLYQIYNRSQQLIYV